MPGAQVPGTEHAVAHTEVHFRIENLERTLLPGTVSTAAGGPPVMLKTGVGRGALHSLSAPAAATVTSHTGVTNGTLPQLGPGFSLWSPVELVACSDPVTVDGSHYQEPGTSGYSPRPFLRQTSHRHGFHGFSEDPQQD